MRAALAQAQQGGASATPATAKPSQLTIHNKEWTGDFDQLLERRMIRVYAPFWTGRYDLRPEAQIVLAKLSGIILSHPGLNLAVEGHTDSVGSDDFNLKLSQRRADTVRDYLVTQGLPDSSVTATGSASPTPLQTTILQMGANKTVALR